MAELEQIYRGEDKDIRVTITESDGVTPIVISALDGLLIYIDVDGTVLARFANPIQSGHAAITVINDAGGVVEVRLLNTQTDDAKIGVVGLEVKVRQGTKESTVRVDEIAELTDAKTATTTP